MYMSDYDIIECDASCICVVKVKTLYYKIYYWEIWFLVVAATLV